MKAFKKISLIISVAFALGINVAHAQYDDAGNEFFNEYGEIASNLPTSYEMQDLTPIEFQLPRADDIWWQKVVYRVVDLREKMNYPLYYPEEAEDGRESLFSLIFKLVKDQKVPAFKYFDDKEVFNKANIYGQDDLEEFLKNYDIIYKVAVDPTTRVKTFEVEDVDIPNRTILKYYLKEAWFFDKHTSTFNVKIISICPVMYAEREAGMGYQFFPLFWIPFDNLRPFFVQKEVMITDRNNGARMSYDDLFIKRRFASVLYKESNLQNRMILQYSGTAADVKREQNRIRTDIINQEQDLWEY